MARKKLSAREMRAFKFQVDTHNMPAEQIAVFARHAGTHRAVWNWACGIIHDHERRVKAHVRQQAAEQTDGTDEAIAELMGDKEWKTVAYEAARDAHPKPHPFTLAAFDKMFTQLATSGEPIGERRDGTPITFGWWKTEKHGVSRNAVNQSLADLDKAYSSYFDRKKKGQIVSSNKPRKDGMPDGFPSLKRKSDGGRFRIVGLTGESVPPVGATPDEVAAIDLKNRQKVLDLSAGGRARLLVPRIGSFRAYGDHRGLRRAIAKGGRPTTAQFSEAGGRWYVSISVAFDPDNPYVAPGQVKPHQLVSSLEGDGVVGVDRGSKVAVATSDEYMSAAPDFYRKSQRSLRRLDRQITRCVKGSNRRKKLVLQRARLHRLIKLQRDTFQHDEINRLLDNYAAVVVEDLQAANMSRRAKAKEDPENPGRYLKNGQAQKRALNKGNQDAAYGEFVRKIEYKAARRGILVVKVDAKFTSQDCSMCGHRAKENRKSQAAFSCVRCGHTENADVNAARNIKKRHTRKSVAGRPTGLPGAAGESAGTTALVVNDGPLAHPSDESGMPDNPEAPPPALQTHRVA